MDAVKRRFTLLVTLAFVLLLPACTRERPLPSATATTSFINDAPTPISVSLQPPAVEPAPQSESEAATTPEPTATVSTAFGETFQYPVQPGDTLLSLAIKFDTEVETIRKLNSLADDNIGVGQPLNIPYIEGMTVEGAPTPTPGPFAYTIQSGDTLGAIAIRFGADPIAIIEYNNLLAPDNLTVGTVIIIPNYQPPSGASVRGVESEDAATGPVVVEGGVIHTVQPGEGLFEIADIYGVSPNDIALTNNLNDTNLLNVGQQLVIPGVSARDAAASRGTIYVVQSGESMLGIAIRYGVTTEEILEANDLSNPDSLFEGQELIIPGN